MTNDKKKKKSFEVMLEFRPLSFKISKTHGYGLSILGIEFNRIGYAFGFNFFNDKYPDRIEYKLRLFALKYYKEFILKTIGISHFSCNECRNPVWKHNLYCSTCDYEMLEDEVTWNEVETEIKK